MYYSQLAMLHKRVLTLFEASGENISNRTFFGIPRHSRAISVFHKIFKNLGCTLHTRRSYLKAKHGTTGPSLRRYVVVPPSFADSVGEAVRPPSG